MPELYNRVYFGGGGGGGLNHYVPLGVYKLITTMYMYGKSV